MARDEQRTEAQKLDRQALAWGLAWTAVNIGIVAMIMLLASKA